MYLEGVFSRALYWEAMTPGTGCHYQPPPPQQPPNRPLCFFFFFIYICSFPIHHTAQHPGTRIARSPPRKQKPAPVQCLGRSAIQVHYCRHDGFTNTTRRKGHSTRRMHRRGAGSALYLRAGSLSIDST